MKLVYLTSKTYPQTTADHFFVLEMARAFAAFLHENFLLVVRNEYSTGVGNIPHYSFGLNIIKGKLLFYFFRLPFFIIRKKFFGRDTVFFTNDVHLLRVLFFWKKILRFKYQVVSDWHMLFGSKNEKDIIQKSDGCVTTTKHLKDLMVSRYGVPESKILVAYGGVDLDLFGKITETSEVLRKRLNLPESAFLVGYVGFYKTMGMSKGIDTMIRALALIEDESIKMVFVGGRPKEMEEYQKLAEEKGVSERSFFVPVVFPEAVALYEKAIDALVIPYPDKPHFCEYGFPMKAYEYLASKKPIIFSNLPIIAEVMGDCAISFNPDDAKDLSEKIIEIKNFPERTIERVASAYEKAQECTWKARAEKIIDYAKTL
ncbi:MAG: glycosyltransferase [Candidatus Pacebacteria bacterium]|jgi:glycosyltransferase involved in cell wall biosynthesis|nr:glycosyltransferase [Candidatus Paceibacterota bacterium]